MLVEPVGKEWLLAKDYKFTFNGKVHTIKKDFNSDGASIPTFAMRFFTHTDLNKMFIASVVHDFLCRNRIGTCKEVNALFKQMCKDNGLGDKWYTKWKLGLVYWACYLYLEYIEGWEQ